MYSWLTLCTSVTITGHDDVGGSSPNGYAVLYRPHSICCILLFLSFSGVSLSLSLSLSHSLSLRHFLPVSTTVVNPHLWMPIYNQNPDAAFFFITFDTAIVFVMHSLGTLLTLNIVQSIVRWSPILTG